MRDRLIWSKSVVYLNVHCTGLPMSGGEGATLLPIATLHFYIYKRKPMVVLRNINAYLSMVKDKLGSEVHLTCSTGLETQLFHRNMGIGLNAYEPH